MPTDTNNLIPFQQFQQMQESAEKGRPLDIKLPGGSSSGHKLTLRGTDSKTFRHAKNKWSRDCAEALAFKDESLTKEEILSIQEDMHETANNLLLGSLIVSWTFGEPCDATNIASLLKGCPMIVEQIDAYTAERANFF